MDEPQDTPAPPPVPAPAEPLPAEPTPAEPPPPEPAEEAGSRGRVKRRRRGRRRVPFGEYLAITLGLNQEAEDEPRSEWPLAPALIQGAVRGGIAGTLLMAFALGVYALEPSLAAFPPSR